MCCGNVPHNVSVYGDRTITLPMAHASSRFVVILGMCDGNNSSVCSAQIAGRSNGHIVVQTTFTMCNSNAGDDRQLPFDYLTIGY